MEANPTSQVHEPYRIADDVWIIPEVVPAAPGTVVPVNSMVITGAEPVVVDTGNELSRAQWLDAAFSVVEPHDVRWVFISHEDHDHVGNLLPVLEARPNATLVTNWFTVERLRRALPLPLDRLRWVNPGERFDAGDRTLLTLRGKHLDEAFHLIRQVARMDPPPLPGQADVDAMRPSSASRPPDHHQTRTCTAPSKSSL